MLKISPGIKHLFYKISDKILRNKIKYYNIKIRSELKKKWIKVLLNHDEGNTSPCNITNFKLFNTLKKLEIFDIGFILIQCAIGNLELIDFNEYLCKHNNECCCFYHCIEKEENNRKKLMLSRLIVNLFSEKFINFICYITSYNLNSSYSIDNIKNHEWILAKDTPNEKVNLQEILLISRDFYFHKDQHFFLKNELGYLDKLFDNIQLILPKCHLFFKNYNISNTNDFLSFYQDNFTYLSKYFSVDRDALVGKIKVVYDNYFRSWIK